MRTTCFIFCTMLIAAFALTGCSRTVIHKGGGPDVVVVKEKQPGPPDHAPAHGHRRNNDHVVLVYNSDLQVYVVESHPNCYYWAGQYFRPGEKGWEWSVDVAGPWRAVQLSSDVPPGLRKMDVSMHQKKAKKEKKDK
jgi:hypothetical protein